VAEFLGLSADELGLFLDETGEHLDTLEAELLALERSATYPGQLDVIFRAAHTIKGAAATVGLEAMAHLTHAMETLLDRMRAGDCGAEPGVTGPLLQAVDVLRRGLTALQQQELPAAPPAELLRLLAAAAAVPGVPATGGVTSDSAIAAAGATVPGGVTSDSAIAAAGAESVVVRVGIAPGCPMPAVRALQVLLALEGLGSVLASEPSQAEVEAEQVGESLVVWLQTGAEAAAVEAALRGIPDLAGVAVAPPPAVPAAAAPAAGQPKAEERTIRVDVALLDDLMNLVGELVIDRGRLAALAQSLGQGGGVQDAAEALAGVTGHVARVTGRLQAAVLKARMLPIERVFRRFPRMVRDLAQQQGKPVDFRLAGEATELDRSLLEVLGDALLHLVRNAVDHGLEAAAERRSAGKPTPCVLQLAASQEEGHVVILVRDDGRGIDPERVRAAAVRKGLLSSERARELGELEAINLLFLPGFSTAEQVTDLSGRGVGLDVVRRNIERVGGRVEVESRLGSGTAFRLILPLTLATMQALLVQTASGSFALPLSAIAEVVTVPPGEVASINGHPVARVRGGVVPLLWVEQFVLPRFRPGRAQAPLLTVLVNHQGEKVGLVVDRLLGQQEVVVKGLGDFFGHIGGVSGVTILGDGGLALIIDVAGLIGQLTAQRKGGSPCRKADLAC